jgi:hypothetical protein
MSLARRPGDCVKKEYKVEPVARNLNKSTTALDVVYIQQLQVLLQNRFSLHILD